jgi:hypothetical protein
MGGEREATDQLALRGCAEGGRSPKPAGEFDALGLVVLLSGR